MALEQIEFCEQVGSQPQGIDAVVSKVPVLDGGEAALTGIVELNDGCNFVVVVGGEKAAVTFGSEELQDS